MKVDFAGRWAQFRQQPGLFVLIMVCVLCFLPVGLQLLGFWDATSAQRGGASSLCDSGFLLMIGSLFFLAVNRLRSRSTRGDKMLLATTGLAVVAGVVGIVVSAGVLLGLLPAIPNVLPLSDMGIMILVGIAAKVCLSRRSTGSAS